MSSNHRTIWLAALAGLTLPLLAAPTQAQVIRDLIAACRADYDRLCSDVVPGGGRIASCLDEQASDLSDKCRTAIRQYRRVAGDERSRLADARLRQLDDIAYGPHPEQKLDVYRPAGVKDAPIILMVHGGAWRIGDKATSSVVDNKVAHWLPRGVIFVSTNYRMLPEADPIKQARDVARALAFVQSRARSWGGDPRKVVLMGHSAGGHLISLLASDPDMAYRAGARPWLGTVSLDGGALDVVTIMEDRHLPLFDRVFGVSPAYWRSASPLHRLSGTPAPMLLVCSTRRSRPCDQARAYAAEAGDSVEVLPVPLSHNQINKRLGASGPYTERVDAFLERLGVL